MSADIVARVCDALLRDDRDAARAIARTEYPFVPYSRAGRAHSELQSVRLSALMIDNGVGVSHRALTVPKVDNDYFEEG